MRGDPLAGRVLMPLDLPPNEREGAIPRVRKINTRPQFGFPIFRPGHGSVSGLCSINTAMKQRLDELEAFLD
jgi:hypothetical protein